MIQYITPINVILFLLIWAWVLATYGAYASLIDNSPDREGKDDTELWIKLIILLACMFCWPYPVVYNAVKLRKL